MTLNEFKAWFEGYAEGLEAAPTKAQFDRIKEKVKEISGTPVTERIFIDKYWPSVFRPWSPPMPVWVSQTAADYTAAMQGVGTCDNIVTSFDSGPAMYALGKAEAQLN